MTEASSKVFRTEENTQFIKDGKEDTLVYSPPMKFSVSTFKVRVLDMVGADDAFNTGFLTMFLEEKPPRFYYLVI